MNRVKKIDQILAGNKTDDSTNHRGDGKRPVLGERTVNTENEVPAILLDTKSTISHDQTRDNKRRINDSFNHRGDNKRPAFGELTNTTENAISVAMKDKKTTNQGGIVKPPLNNFKKPITRSTTSAVQKNTTASSSFVAKQKIPTASSSFVAKQKITTVLSSSVAHQKNTVSSSSSTAQQKNAAVSSSFVAKQNNVKAVSGFAAVEKKPSVTNGVGKRNSQTRASVTAKENKIGTSHNAKKIVKTTAATQKPLKLNKVTTTNEVKGLRIQSSADVQALNLQNVEKLSALDVNEIQSKTNGAEHTAGVKKLRENDTKELLIVPNSLQLSTKSSDGGDNNSLYVSALENQLFRGPDLPDYDRELLRDPHQVSEFAMEIFEYMKSRETEFIIVNYMQRQTDLTCNMRALLVDWMVEIQENFELNHETLYSAVKYVDLYLNREEIVKENLQLVGATAIFLACKNEETILPLLDDFVHVCDNAYTKRDILKMEIRMLRSLEFKMSVPLSYSFLRRYARSIQLSMPFLTLARYILELSLLEYSAVFLMESKQAAAALYLALKMTKQHGWNKTLESCSGYKVKDFKYIVLFFNAMLRRDYKDLAVIKNKYLNEVFFEAAKTPQLRDEELDLPSDDDDDVSSEQKSIEFMCTV